MFFSRSKPLVGLDIGTSSIKAVVLKPRGKGKGFALQHMAIEPLPPEVIVEGMKAAKAAGAVTSFDLNYRAKLWAISGGLGKAQETLRGIVEHCDVLVGNEEDLQKGLGLKGQDVEKKGKLDPSAFFGMMEGVAKDLPNVQAVATTLREVVTTNHHNWSAVLKMVDETETRKQRKEKRND